MLGLKTEENLNRQLVGEEYIENDYVFKRKNGELFRPDYVTRVFIRTVKKAGLGHITFHALRHSTASILYDKGWEVKDIQTWMRHKQVSTTMQLYIHISKMRKHIIASDLKDCFKP
ncbi:MAG: tyrosine-type recombinase/integrase [Oscillospiraceae bacterium]|nr:tyrosine-type recombinase/integrase [Oscillospiraceae bacterium]